MPDTNFHQLLIFHNVAQLGSFTKAARELNISQPAVSIQVKELERSLNTVLVNRVRRGVFLTGSGEVVYEYTKRIFSLADEMRLAVQDLEGLQAGRLTIGSSSTPGEYILPLAMGIFRERYPKSKCHSPSPTHSRRRADTQSRVGPRYGGGGRGYKRSQLIPLCRG